MFKLRFILFFLLLISAQTLLAATFIVTSNNDSGPGTLRQALTDAAANGSAEKDYINFNIADVSEAGRTITVTSQLPDISSNLVIDASTQVGNKFGVSDAKVGLFFNTPAQTPLSGIRIIGQSNVEIYGLYIKNFTGLTDSPTSYLWQGIELKSDNNIQIGAAGKGNVIAGFTYPITTNYQTTGGQIDLSMLVSGLIIRDTFWGIDADGKTLSMNDSGQSSLWSLSGNNTIGGTPTEGNLIAKGFFLDQFNMDNYNLIPDATITIKNNKIGVDFAAQSSITGSKGLFLQTLDPDGRNTIYIEDNVIAAEQANAIQIGNMGKPITIVRNYIGTNKTLTHTFTTNGIFLYGAQQISIGSSNPTDANYITNCNPVTIWPYTNATVNKNIFYCTKNATAMHYQGYGEFDFPFVYITNISANSLKGTATPNSTIELFYSDHCGSWQPETYFATVTTDSKGSWTYNGTITGYVIASATLGKNTSDFSTTGIDINQIKVNSVCTGLGSITGVVPHSYTNLKWVNEQGTTVGTTPNLLNIPVGKYKLIIQYGTNTISTDYFEVKKYVPISFTQTNVNITKSCADFASGSITVAITPSPATYRWVNASTNETVGNSNTVKNLPAGIYQLYLADINGCESHYNDYKIESYLPLQIIGIGTISNDRCGFGNGSVTGITVAGGQPPYTYTWVNEANSIVSTTKDLLNSTSGVYKLQVKDITMCNSASISATIEAEGELISTPMANSYQICAPGNLFLSVSNPSASTKYRLYDNLSSIDPLDEQTGGIFKVNVSNDRSFYISQLSGYCESNRAEIKVSVAPTSVNIANTITPNGDGINDYWVIKNIENYPAAEVQLYNRYGQKVFESKGYSTPFGGTLNGSLLATGTYYYIINLNSGCNLLSGSLTIIR